MTKYYRKGPSESHITYIVLLVVFIWAWSKTSMQLLDALKQINSPGCVWWSRLGRSFLPTRWTSCTLRVLSGTSCPESLGARRTASCHWSRCRRRCCSSESVHGRWDSRPPGPSSDLRTRSSGTGACWTPRHPSLNWIKETFRNQNNIYMSINVIFCVTYIVSLMITRHFIWRNIKKEYNESLIILKCTVCTQMWALALEQDYKKALWKMKAWAITFRSEFESMGGYTYYLYL